MNDEQMEMDQCVSQKSHFDHLDEFMLHFQVIINANPDVREATKSFARLNEILNLYQEQSHLLDPHLESMIQPVMTRLRDDIDSCCKNEEKTMVPETITLTLFQLLYLLTKTRGFKTIVKFMSHEVVDLEPVFEFLSGLDPTNPKLWMARYVCFIWLSLICMIPFDLKRIDSGSQNEESLIMRMLSLCKKYLCSTGKERDGASLLVARLLSRQDLCHEYLIPYFKWTKERLSGDADVFEATGILQSLCITYQLAPRAVLLPTLDDVTVPLLIMPLFDQYVNNSLVRKLRTKLTQRAGLCYLKPKLASWRYQRGNRSLRQNLEGVISSSSGGMASTATSLSTGNTQKLQHDEDDDEEDIPENLETIIEILLNGLRDKDTIVRWSAAKGIGRITQRLPQELAEDVIGSLLELFKENTFTDKTGELDLSAVSDHTWHGASLAVAELARRGLLLPERLEESIPWIIKGLKFDLKRGSHSIGSHVRDACCYVCWAFARAYAPSVMEPFVAEIAQNLVIVSVFDREINVRRASSAAFQENVGRQGIFPHGIEIIQDADYFSLGNRNNAFLSIAFNIAQFEEYRYHLIQHLVSVSVKHWDKPMRVLASKALYNLVPLDPTYFIEKAFPILIPNATNKDLQISHGSMLAIAEISLALYKTQDPLVHSLYYSASSLLTPIISNLPPRSLTTFGSEHIREAACHLITCLSKTRVEITTPILDDWKKVIHSSLERKEENVQEYAVLAFGSVAETYGIDQEEVQLCLKKIEIFDNPQKYGRRGYALALGTVAYTRHVDWVHDVVVQLCKASQAQEDHEANDAEAKRNSVLGLCNVIKSLGDDLKKDISYDDFQYIIESCHACLTDYSTDQRGDVGSWVRVATMNLLNYLLPQVSMLDVTHVHDSKPYLSTEISSKLIGALLKQSVERIDKIRASAGNVLCDLVLSSQYLKLSSHECLKQYISRDLSWSAPSDLYSVMVNLLKIPEYRFELLTGLIASAGGLTESLVRHSSSCLIEYLDNLPVADAVDSCSLETIFNTMLTIFQRYERQDRVTIPLMDVAGLLYESGTLVKITNNTLHMKLFTLVKKEGFRCKNAIKLLSVIKVYAGLISIESSEVKVKALQQMLSYLVHAFPRVRTEASNQLFAQLSLFEEADEDENIIQALDIITGTNWSEALPQIKPERDRLYPLLKVPKPIMVKK